MARASGAGIGRGWFGRMLALKFGQPRRPPLPARSKFQSAPRYPRVSAAFGALSSAARGPVCRRWPAFRRSPAGDQSRLDRARPEPTSRSRQSRIEVLRRTERPSRRGRARPDAGRLCTIRWAGPVPQRRRLWSGNKLTALTRDPAGDVCCLRPTSFSD
jgi:hypothetical protein